MSDTPFKTILNADKKFVERLGLVGPDAEAIVRRGDWLGGPGAGAPGGAVEKNTAQFESLLDPKTIYVALATQAHEVAVGEDFDVDVVMRGLADVTRTNGLSMTVWFGHTVAEYVHSECFTRGVVPQSQLSNIKQYVLKTQLRKVKQHSGVRMAWLSPDSGFPGEPVSVIGRVTLRATVPGVQQINVTGEAFHWTMERPDLRFIGLDTLVMAR